MTDIEKKVQDAIQAMLSMSTDFVERHNKNGNRIEPELFEDLLYFTGRGEFVAQVLNHKDFAAIINQFKGYHLQPNMRKSVIIKFEPDFKGVISYLKVIKRELDEGLIIKLIDIVRGEVFDSFIESGKYFNDNGHPVPAAVILGTVLENEIRNLSISNGLPVQDAKGKWLSLETMNIALCKAGIYKLGVQKMITACYDTRSNAAHGQYALVTKKDVENLYDFVSDFNNQIT